jgi:single-stranded-DNA-specific exonuclease
MPKTWRIVASDLARIAELERAAGIPSVVAQLLLSRGIETADDARRFLECKLTGLRDPEELPGVRAASERIMAAINARERIVIYGDYDADGMTATAILYRCLRLLGADVGYYVPCRLEEGYGLSEQALTRIAADGAKLVVTVDCGIASTDEAEAARRLGLSLVITDHHHPGERLPAAEAIVHPRVPSGGYPFGDLCGSGVAFKLAWAVCQRASGDRPGVGARRVTEKLRDFLLQAVGLAAIGTVADVVPLVDENRILVRHGLASLFARPVMGIAALAHVTGLGAKSGYDSEDVAFTIGPRLNAAGRLGQAQLAVELLVTDSAERAAALAEYIHELNESRQSLERRILRAATALATEQFDPEGDPALVLAADDWHVGVIGIVAGRLAEKYQRPVILISHDPLAQRPSTGSARGVPGVHLHEALCACREHLVSYGGHTAAAGLRIEAARVDAFRAAFCEHVAATSDHAARDAELAIDAEAPLTTLTHQIVQQMESLAPFGAGNHRPLLCTRGVRIDGEIKRIGGGGRHLSLSVSQHGKRIRAVAFGGGDWEKDLSRLDRPFSIAFRPVINNFRGKTSVEMQLADWRVDD